MVKLEVGQEDAGPHDCCLTPLREGESLAPEGRGAVEKEKDSKDNKDNPKIQAKADQSERVAWLLHQDTLESPAFLTTSCRNASE